MAGVGGCSSAIPLPGIPWVAERAESDLEWDERHTGDVTLTSFWLDDAPPGRECFGRCRLGPGRVGIPGPAAMLLDDLVYLPHQVDGIVERYDDLLVVGDVVIGQPAAPPAL